VATVTDSFIDRHEDVNKIKVDHVLAADDCAASEEFAGPRVWRHPGHHLQVGETTTLTLCVTTVK
jgi:hypothetical protein